MSGQRIEVQMHAALDVARLRDLLEAEGFEVSEIVEVRSGPVFSAVHNIVTFIVEHLDDVLIPVLSGVVLNWLTKGPLKRSLGGRGTNFTAKDSERIVIVNVTGDGNWVQVHPRPDLPDEEE